MTNTLSETAGWWFILLWYSCVCLFFPSGWWFIILRGCVTVLTTWVIPSHSHIPSDQFDPSWCLDAWKTVLEILYDFICGLPTWFGKRSCIDLLRTDQNWGGWNTWSPWWLPRLMPPGTRPMISGNNLGPHLLVSIHPSAGGRSANQRLSYSDTLSCWQVTQAARGESRKSDIDWNGVVISARFW